MQLPDGQLGSFDTSPPRIVTQPVKAPQQTLAVSVQVLFEKIAQFVKELRAGGPALSDSSEGSPAAASESKPAPKAAQATSSAPKVLSCTCVPPCHPLVLPVMHQVRCCQETIWPSPQTIVMWPMNCASVLLHIGCIRASKVLTSAIDLFLPCMDLGGTGSAVSSGTSTFWALGQNTLKL